MAESRRDEIAGTRDEREHALEERLRRSREMLITRGNVFANSLRSAFDVMAPVRRNPVGGVAAALSSGVLLGGLWSFLGRKGSRKDGFTARYPIPPGRASMVTAMLWRFLPALGPALMAWIQSRSARRSQPPEPEELSSRRTH